MNILSNFVSKWNTVQTYSILQSSTKFRRLLKWFPRITETAVIILIAVIKTTWKGWFFSRNVGK